MNAHAKCHHLSQVTVPLLSLVFLILGNSMLLTLVPIRLQEMQVSALVIGWVSSAYYLGIMAGSFLSEWIVLRIGHVRTFTAFGALVVVATLLHLLFPEPYWLPLRFLSGYCIATLFVVIESWVLIYSDEHNRGVMLAVYMLAMYGAQSGGQFLLYSLMWDEFFHLVILCGIWIALSITTLTITKSDVPVFDQPKPLSLSYLLTTSPSGFIGCFSAGLILSVVYSVLPAHLSQYDLQSGQVALIMGCIIGGGMCLQYPMGRLSDRFPRQQVMMSVGLVALVLVVAIGLLKPTSWDLLLFFVFGGCVFTIYPLAVSHTCDLLDKQHMVAAIQGLLIAYGLGSTIGPTLSTTVMHHLSEKFGIHVYLSVVLLALILIILMRSPQKASPTVAQQGEYVGMAPDNTPVLVELDPRSEPSPCLEAGPISAQG